MYVAAAAVDAARPQYGGTLRVAAAGAIRSLTPGATVADPADAALRDCVLPLVFETLTHVDADAGLQPMLALSWTSDARGGRWTFRLRPNVVLHDGGTLAPWQVAASLRAVEPRWRIATDNDAVIVETSEAVPDLPWRLADSAYAIAIRSAQDQLAGTGPFRLDRIDASGVALRAHDTHRDGRPFLDGITVQTGRTASAQVSDLEAGRADFAGIQPTDLRRVVQRGLRVVASRPRELVAIVFEPHRAGDGFAAVRRTLAASINRATMSAVLLQQQAAPASGVLPGWIAGYDLSAAARGRTLARAAVAALPIDQRELAIRVDASDPLAQAIAERVAVDAKEAGFSLKVQAPTGLVPRPDARLIRVRVLATTPERALADLLPRLPARPDAAAQPPAIASLEDALRAEAALIERGVVIPIVHLSDLYAVGERVSSWQSTPVLKTGVWNLADVWIRSAPP